MVWTKWSTHWKIWSSYLYLIKVCIAGKFFWRIVPLRSVVAFFVQQLTPGYILHWESPLGGVWYTAEFILPYIVQLGRVSYDAELILRSVSYTAELLLLDSVSYTAELLCKIHHQVTIPLCILHCQVAIMQCIWHGGILKRIYKCNLAVYDTAPNAILWCIIHHWANNCWLCCE